MHALYYPFHLCHERTLDLLLEKYEIVHFRDFMALQLTRMMGTTAFPDRMGDYHPEYLKAGRIVQGHNLCGAISPATALAINRDLADPQWRNYFQESILKDHRFQRGLFGEAQQKTTGAIEPAPTAEWLQFSERGWALRSFDVETVQALSRQRLHGEAAPQFEYGWALIKTAASLVYTIQLCHQLQLVAVTDSSAHHQLLMQTCERDQIDLDNSCVKREGY
jgi:hypothetical protein